jgi:hypothetical protein
MKIMRTSHKRQVLAALPRVLLIATLAGAPVCAPAAAADITGTWATDPNVCNKIFVRQGNEIGFTELSDFDGGGIVIEPTRLRGKIASCQIQSRTDVGDTVRFTANCATTMMHSTEQFNLKKLDNNTLSRSFTGLPEITIIYHRCVL